MRFRPCIDIHNGRVKQIVGGSLADKGSKATDNFVSELEADFYAELYKEHDLTGGHIIILNPRGSEFYQADLEQAEKALRKFPGGLQIGGGMTPENAGKFLDMGASHVIVTSYVFRNGMIDFERLEKLKKAVGKDRLVLDLSCRRKGDKYFVVTDRWQKFTDTVLDKAAVSSLEKYCGEFLIHAVDAEGKAGGVERQVVSIMSESCSIPATYAGGISSMEDIQLIRSRGGGKLDFTVGSALDIFGGTLSFEELSKLG